MIKSLRKWYLSFGFQGMAYGMASLVISLFVVTSLGGNVANASVAMALFSVGNLVGSIFTGVFLDRYPHFFAVVFVSALMNSVISLFMSQSQHIGPYYLLSLMMGFFLSMMSPAIITYLNKKYDDETRRREINILNMFNSVGVSVGIFEGGGWLALNLSFLSGNAEKMRWIFVIAGLLFGVSAAFAATYLKRRTKIVKHISRRFSMNAHSIAGNIMSLPHNVISPFKASNFKPETKRYMVGLFMVFFGANMFFTPFPIFLKNILGMPSGFIFIVYGFSGLFTNLAYLFTNRAMARFRDMSIMGSVIWIRISMFLLIAFMGLISHIPLAIWITVASFMIIGFTWPFFYIPATIQVTNLALPENRGKIIGLFNMVINLGAISASFIAGYVALKFGYFAIFAMGALVLFTGNRILRKIALTYPIRRDFHKSENRKLFSKLRDIIIKNGKRLKWGVWKSSILKLKSVTSHLVP